MPRRNVETGGIRFSAPPGAKVDSGDHDFADDLTGKY